MNKFFFVLFIILLFSNKLIGQDIDYKVIRKQLSTLSCGKVDSVDVYNTKVRLETFDTTKIIKDIDYYYRDLAWCYYRIFIKHYDTTYLKLDIDNYIKSLYHKPDDSQALWNCSFGYYKLGDCINGKKYMELYKKYTDEKYWDKAQIQSITKNCID